MISRSDFGPSLRNSAGMVIAKHKVEKFPLTVKRASSVVKVYEDRKQSGTYYRVVYYLGGKRHWLSVGDLDVAKPEAAAKAAQLARGDVDAVQLTGRDRLLTSI